MQVESMQIATRAVLCVSMFDVRRVRRRSMKDVLAAWMWLAMTID
jgi:hypothetical protein